MGMNLKEKTNQRFDSYGGQIWHWPEGRGVALLMCIFSSSFRRNLSTDRRLANSIRNVGSSVDVDRVERRLLAVMGVGKEIKSTFGFSIRKTVSFASLSLVLGLVMGGLLSDLISIQGGYAGLSETEWMLPDDELDFEEIT
jgi:hypothetical protein